MIGKLRCFFHKSPFKIPIVVCVLLLTAVLNIYFYKLDSENLSDFRDEMNAQHEEIAWTEVETMVKMANTASRQNSRYLAKRIEVDILRQYENLDLLRAEFSSNQFSKDFHNVLKRNLVNDNGTPSALYPPSYYTAVGLDKGVIAIFSNEASATLTSSNEDSIIDWKSYADSQINPTLAKQAIDSVLKRENEVIFMQSENDSERYLSSLTSMNMDTLRQAYEKYGFEALKYYSILSPSYITETGDIFETDDYTFTSKNNNYKLIILQSFNLYDVLKEFKYEIGYVETHQASSMTFLNDFINYKLAKTIFWSFLLFVISMFLVHVYNRDYSHKREDETKGDVVERQNE